MKIPSITHWSVTLMSHQTYYLADGKSCDSVDTIIARLTDETGLSGSGEVCPTPHYLPAIAHGIPAAPGFLQGLRDLCDKHHVLLSSARS